MFKFSRFFNLLRQYTLLTARNGRDYRGQLYALADQALADHIAAGGDRDEGVDVLSRALSTYAPQQYPSDWQPFASIPF